MANVALVNSATGNANSNDADNKADQIATVSAGVTLLVVALSFRRDVSGLSVVWDPTGANEALTRVGTGIFNGGRCEIFIKINPTAGAAKTIHAAWTTNSDVVFTVATFSNTDTSTGIDAAHTTTASGTSTTPAVTVTSTADGASVGIAAQVTSNWSSTSGGTQITLDNATFVNGAGSYFDAAHGGTTSNAHGWVQDSSGAWSTMGVHILAAAAGGPTAAQQAGIFDAQRSGGIIGRVDA